MDFFTKTVDSALASFNKIQEDLRKIADKHGEEIASYEDQQREIADKKLHAQTEKTRALSVIGKIDSLISA